MAQGHNPNFDLPADQIAERLPHYGGADPHVARFSVALGSHQPKTTQTSIAANS